MLTTIVFVSFLVAVYAQISCGDLDNDCGQCIAEPHCEYCRYKSLITTFSCENKGRCDGTFDKVINTCPTAPPPTPLPPLPGNDRNCSEYTKCGHCTDPSLVKDCVWCDFFVTVCEVAGGCPSGGIGRGQMCPTPLPTP